MGGGAEAQEATRALALPSPVLPKLARSAVQDARASCGSGRFLLGSSTSPEDLCLPRISSCPAVLGEEDEEREEGRGKEKGPAPQSGGEGVGSSPGFTTQLCQCASFPVPQFPHSPRVGNACACPS